MLEYAAGGDLIHRLEAAAGSTTIFPWIDRIRCALDIAEGMQYIHSQGFLQIQHDKQIAPPLHFSLSETHHDVFLFFLTIVMFHWIIFVFLLNLFVLYLIDPHKKRTNRINLECVG